MKKMITRWCLDNFRYYVVFSKGIFFLLGLVCTYQFVENAVFSILVTYISDGWSDPDMPKAAIIVNIHQGTYKVLQIFFAYVKDAYLGLFKMLVCCTPLYVIGLLLCFTSYLKQEDFLDPRMFYTGLVLLTLSHAGIEVTLKEFLEDQVLATDQQSTETKEEIETYDDTTKIRAACSRKDFWWFSASVLAAIIAIVGFSRITSFKMLLMVSTIAMGIAFLWFLLGKTFYKVDNQLPADNPLRDALFVIRTAINERGESYPDEQIPPHVSWLRWLDRAANNVDEEALGREKVKGVKFLLKMLPMWMTFITFSVVSATGNTFFLEQAAEIKDEGIFILLFIYLKGFTGFVAEKISNYVLEKYFNKKKNIVQKMMLARIGVGMICCVLCCITAWRIAAWRYRHPEWDNVSIFVLTPQFVLLGFMTGLAEKGLESFFDSQVSEKLNGYGQHFGQFVIGLGKYFSVVCIVIFRKNWFGWLKDDIGSSRLDKYYAVLAVLSLGDLIIYCLVAYWYGDDTFLSEDHKVDAENTLSIIKEETDPSDAQYQTTSDIKQHVRPLDISSRLTQLRSFQRRPSADRPSNGAYRRIHSG